MNSITFFISFIPLLALILLGINLIFAPHNPYQEKSSTFECGFHSFLGQNRTQFNISFFVFGLLFLVFDLELVMALPGLINIYNIGEYGISFMLIFFTILTIGFAFELGKKALSIDSRQSINDKKSSFIALNIYWLHFVNWIRVSILSYKKNFCIYKLIIGVIILKIILITISYTLYLFNCIDYNNISTTSSYIVLLLILYKIIKTPWNIKMNNFFISLFFNILIINLIITFVILIYHLDLDIFSSCFLMHVFVFSDNSDISDSYVYMNTGGGPSNNWPQWPGGGFPNSDPGNNGPGNDNVYANPEPKESQNLKGKNREWVREFLGSWLGSATSTKAAVGTKNALLEVCATQDKVTAHQSKSLHMNWMKFRFLGFGPHDRICVEIDILIDDSNDKFKTFAFKVGDDPEKDRVLFNAISRIDKWANAQIPNFAKTKQVQHAKFCPWDMPPERISPLFLDEE